MKKPILLMIGLIIAAIALIIPSQDPIGPVTNQISHQGISFTNPNGELLRANVIHLDSVTYITTLIISSKPKLNNSHNTL